MKNMNEEDTINHLMFHFSNILISIAYFTESSDYKVVNALYDDMFVYGFEFWEVCEAMGRLCELTGFDYVPDKKEFDHSEYLGKIALPARCQQMPAWVEREINKYEDNYLQHC